MQLWDAWMGQERAALPGHAGGACYVGFSAGGRTLATASQSHTARLWHAVFPAGD